MFDRLKHVLRFPRKADGKVPFRDRRIRPEAAGLEPRALLTTVPSGLATKLVFELYADLFHRVVTTPELTYNVNALQNGEPVENLVHKLVTSDERKSVEVVAYYDSYLGRNPELGGLVNGLGELNAGTTPVQLQEQIIASPEFQNNHQSNSSYVTALYAEVLGRPVTSSELTTWDNALNEGYSRAKIAQIMFNSQEYATLLINSDFLLVVHRPADPGAITYWTPNVLSTQKDGDLLVSLFTSTENFNNLAKLP